MRAILLILLQLLVSCVMCDYQLRVRVHSYLNAGSRCAVCTQSLINPVHGCCDNNSNTGQCTGEELCDTFFRYCLRPLGDTSVTCPSDATVNDTAFFSPNTDSVLEFGDNVFGTPNPFTFNGQTWTGMQFYLKSVDSDMPEGGSIQIIDSFAVDVAIQAGQNIEPQVYEGGFELAEIELSFEVVCTDNFSLPDCTPCEPDSSPICLNRQQNAQYILTPTVLTPPVRTEAPLGAIVGGVFGTIVVILLVVAAVGIAVVYTVWYRRKDHEKMSIPPTSPHALGDNPVYAAAVKQQPNEQNSISISGTLSFAAQLDVEELKEEREFDNPLYGDATDNSTSKEYASIGDKGADNQEYAYIDDGTQQYAYITDSVSGDNTTCGQ